MSLLGSPFTLKPVPAPFSVPPPIRVSSHAANHRVYKETETSRDTSGLVEGDEGGEVGVVGVVVGRFCSDGTHSVTTS